MKFKKKCFVNIVIVIQWFEEFFFTDFAFWTSILPALLFKLSCVFSCFQHVHRSRSGDSEFVRTFSVVYGFCCTCVQQMEQVRDPLLCRRAACIRNRHVLACQHIRCKFKSDTRVFMQLIPSVGSITLRLKYKPCAGSMILLVFSCSFFDSD